MREGDSKNREDRHNSKDQPKPIELVGLITPGAVPGTVVLMELLDQVTLPDDGNKYYWSARALARALGYSNWSNFHPVLERAKNSCISTRQDVALHFQAGLSTITTARGKRFVPDIHLSRHACLLLVQCADPSKKQVAQAQVYIAIKTIECEHSRVGPLNEDSICAIASRITQVICKNTSPSIRDFCQTFLEKRLRREQSLDTGTLERVQAEMTHLLKPFLADTQRDE